jgi:hypothetical protein
VAPRRACAELDPRSARRARRRRLDVAERQSDPALSAAGRRARGTGGDAGESGITAIYRPSKDERHWRRSREAPPSPIVIKADDTNALIESIKTTAFGHRADRRPLEHDPESSRHSADLSQGA